MDDSVAMLQQSASRQTDALATDIRALERIIDDMRIRGGIVNHKTEIRDALRFTELRAQKPVRQPAEVCREIYKKFEQAGKNVVTEMIRHGLDAQPLMLFLDTLDLGQAAPALAALRMFKHALKWAPQHSTKSETKTAADKIGADAAEPLTDLQIAILKALDGRRLSPKDLIRDTDSKNTFYRPGAIDTLLSKGLVVASKYPSGKKTRFYFRPSSPLPECTPG